MFVLKHSVCNRDAYYFLERPVVGQRVDSKNVRLLNGEPPTIGSRMVCGSCGKPVKEDNLVDEFLRETPAAAQ